MKQGLFQNLKNRLKWKIIGPVLVGFIVVMAAMVWLAISISSSEIGKMGENKGMALCNITSESLKTSLMFEDVESSKGNISNLLKDQGVLLAEVYDKDKKRVAIVFNPVLIDNKIDDNDLDAKAKAKRVEEITKELTEIYTSSFDPKTLDEIGKDTDVENVGKKKSNILVGERDVVGEQAQFFSAKILGDSNDILGYMNLALSFKVMKDATAKITSWMVLISLFSIAFIGLISSYIISRLIKPLINATDIMEELSEGEGDLTIRIDVKSSDEVGQLAENFNRFIEKLAHIVSEVKDSSDEINNGTREISAVAKTSPPAPPNKPRPLPKRPPLWKDLPLS